MSGWLGEQDFRAIAGYPLFRYLCAQDGIMLSRRFVFALALAGLLFAPAPQSNWFSPLSASPAQAQEAPPGPENPGMAGAVAGSSAIFLPIMVRGGQSATNPEHTGEGTYYDATGAGNCSFPASPEDLMVAAMNHADYANAALCGAYVAVVGPQGSVTVRIVDRCPECATGDIDFSKEAFVRIAPLVAGRVPIQWHIVSPTLHGPVVYRFKEGSNQWWTAVQIRNHRNPIAKLEYRDSSGEFMQIPRLDYNYFVAASGMGPGPYTLRATDMYGNVLVDEGIPHVEGGEVAGSAQFPAGP